MSVLLQPHARSSAEQSATWAFPRARNRAGLCGGHALEMGQNSESLATCPSPAVSAPPLSRDVARTHPSEALLQAALLFLLGRRLDQAWGCFPIRVMLTGSLPGWLPMG